jgi:hypothetical protein
MPDSAPTTEHQPRGASFAERLSPLIARGGVIATPAVLVRYQARLGLTANELVYVLHVLSHKWDAGWPYVAVGDVAEAAGVHTKMARRWKTSLQAKG